MFILFGGTMNIPFEVEGFEGRDLYVKTATLLTNPRLFLDQKEVRKVGNVYVLEDNTKDNVLALVRYNYIDPVPKIEIRGTIIELLPDLKRHEYMWICIPLLMTLEAGPIGLLLGYIASVYNAVIFRHMSIKSPRYSITGILTIFWFIFMYAVLL